MAHELRPGRLAVYQGSSVEIMELIGHDQVLVRMSTGISRVKRHELIVMPVPGEALGNTRVADISNESWAEACRRAAAVKNVLAVDSDRTQVVACQAAKLNISPRHLWRLIGEYRQHQSVSGLTARSAGRRHGTYVLDPVREWIIADRVENFYLQKERPTIKALHERVAADCRAKGLVPVSRKTITRRLESYNHRDAQLRRLGSKRAKYLYQGMPGHVDVSAPLERVEIDHTPLDVMVSSDDPLCHYIGRPWLTVAIDVYSRCVLGIHIGFEPPSVLSVALCLTHAVLPKHPASEFGVPLAWPMHGVPREIVVDNGKDFVSTAFRRGCDEYGIVLSYRPVGSPHYGGTIERVIGTLIGQCHLLPGTTKNSVRAKGDYDSKKHAAMTLRQVRAWFVEQLLGRYHLNEHRMIRIPPAEAWKRGMGEGYGSPESA